MRFGASIQGALKRACRLPATVQRSGRRSVALGAVLLVASTATVLATANTPVTITALTANTSQLNAGEALILTGTFADPDPGDAHTVFVYWHDDVMPVGQAEKIQLAPGQHAFQLSHVYPVPVSQRTVHFTIGDRQQPYALPHVNDNQTGEGRDHREIPIAVGPANPTQTKQPDQQPRFVESSIKLTKTPGKTGLVSIQGTWNDGDDNAGIVTLVPSDEQLPKGLPACSSAGHQFKCLYQFPVTSPATPKTWVYALEVTDGHGGNGTYKGTVQIP
jgi:hypothetical protein